MRDLHHLTGKPSLVPVLLALTLILSEHVPFKTDVVIGAELRPQLMKVLYHHLNFAKHYLANLRHQRC